MKFVIDIPDDWYREEWDTENSYLLITGYKVGDETKRYAYKIRSSDFEVSHSLLDLRNYRKSKAVYELLKEMMK
jgi:hypothetical protein